MSGILMMSVGNSYGALPVNTVAPVVSGTATVGQTLTTTNGTWLGAPAPTFTYQWQRGVSNISGATSSTYVLVSADAGNTVRCVVTATNPLGSVSANSNSTATVAAPPVNTVAPVVSGTASVGATLSTTNGTWTGTPAPSFSYQWQRNTSNISGATSSTYVIQLADVGFTLRCVVTGTNSVGSASANSNSTGTVADLAFGSATSGGYYAGRIVVSGVTFAVIVAPKASGQGTGRLWRTSDGTAPSAAITLNNGLDASASMNSGAYPAAQFCEGLSIGGFNDWYLPARDELELCFRNLKPSPTGEADPNNTSTRNISEYTYPQGNDVPGNTMGVNLNSSPQGGAYTTTGVPQQASATIFRTGNSEAFDEERYWSSSVYSSTGAWSQDLHRGAQASSGISTSTFRPRAVRRVAV